MLKFILPGVLLLIFIYLCVKPARRNMENFKILGSLAPQKQMYWHCLSECERGDPSLQLTKTKGSMTCQAYCDSTITDIVRRGGPSYTRDEPVKSVPITTSIDQSYALCGDGTKGAFCRKNFSTNSEIDKKCMQNCAYSTLPANLCMTQCSNVLSVNKSSGWSWK
jgi:hypothetical protein